MGFPSSTETVFDAVQEKTGAEPGVLPYAISP
jgi:hypothetical protein